MKLAFVAALAAAAAAVVVGSGIVPVRASSGHWLVTDKLLHFAMRRSVDTWSRSVRVPNLSEAGLVELGAVHYDLGCRPCHGLPGGAMPRVPQRMTPAPPSLAISIPHWEARELFYIVQHGIKFTGMPAWPAQQRDDEVWAIVAFLRELPGMSVERYRELAAADTDGAVAAQAPPDLAFCARCHGEDGRGRSPLVPDLAGQREAYLRNALEAYAEGRRHSGFMQPIAAALTHEQRSSLAAAYAGMPSALTASQRAPRHPRRVERGRRIAEHGVPPRRIPPCAQCHGPRQQKPNAAYPVLAGQHRRYLLRQLRLLHDDRRGGSRYVRLMRPFAPQLTPQQMRSVALYHSHAAR